MKPLRLSYNNKFILGILLCLTTILLFSLFYWKTRHGSYRKSRNLTSTLLLVVREGNHHNEEKHLVSWFQQPSIGIDNDEMGDNLHQYRKLIILKLTNKDHLAHHTFRNGFSEIEKREVNGQTIITLVMNPFIYSNHLNSSQQEQQQVENNLLVKYNVHDVVWMADIRFNCLLDDITHTIIDESTLNMCNDLNIKALSLIHQQHVQLTQQQQAGLFIYLSGYELTKFSDRRFYHSKFLMKGENYFKQLEQLYNNKIDFSNVFILKVPNIIDTTNMKDNASLQDDLLTMMIRQITTEYPIYITQEELNERMTFVKVDQISNLVFQAMDMIYRFDGREGKGVREILIDGLSNVNGTELLDVVKGVLQKDSVHVSILPHSPRKIYKYLHALFTDFPLFRVRIKNQISIHTIVKEKVMQLFEDSKQLIVKKHKNDCNLDIQYYNRYSPRLIDGCTVALLEIDRVYDRNKNGFIYLEARVGQAGIARFVIEKNQEKEEEFYLLDKSKKLMESSFRMAIDEKTRKFILLTNGTQTLSLEAPSKLVEWDGTSYPFSFQYICCPKEKTNPFWPFFSFSPHYFRNYFHYKLKKSSYCEKLEDSVQYFESELVRIAKLTIPFPTNSSKFTEKGKPIYLPKEQVCDNDCSLPLVCVKSANCLCERAEHCTPRNPKLPVTIENLLTPLGRSIKKNQPPIHFYNSSHFTSIESNKKCVTDVFRLDYISHIITQALSVPKNQSSAIMLPAYQACFDGTFEMIEKEKSQFDLPIITTLAHDYGSCVSFHWSYDEMVNKKNNRITPAMEQVFSIQHNGDYSFQCYHSRKDIVGFPDVTIRVHYKTYYESEGRIKGAKERSRLAFLKPNIWGSSLFLRMGVVECNDNIPNLVDSTMDYITNLNNTRYCIVVGGLAGWSFRMAEVMAMGCVPVIAIENIHLPFGDLIDYSKFTIRIDIFKDYHRIGDYLNSIPYSHYEYLYNNLMLVREISIHKVQTQLQEWTLQDMILRSLFARLNTYKY